MSRKDGVCLMIRKFTVTNFRGFRKTICLDLTRKREYTFNSHLINNDIISKGIIYGKNGSGKSNLGYALYDLTYHLSDKQRPTDIYYLNYSNLWNDTNVVTFSYEFEFEGKVIIYTYQKTAINDLVNEKIEIDNKIVLWYDYSSREMSLNITGLENLQIELLDNKLSILKYIYRNTPTNDESPVSKIVAFADGMLWFRSLNHGNNYIGFLNGSSDMNDIIIKNNKLKDFEKFLNENELNYTLFVKNVNNQELIYVKYNDKVAQFSTVASTGTQALWLYFCWSIYFESVSFLFLDEFDAFYHYESAETIIRAINSNKNMQAFVTSHNTYLMRNSITRPDCCFILTQEKISSLSDCTDKEIREAHNLEKMYRNGAFTE